MRIAVYGGAGMVGSRIVAEARLRDHAVTILARRPLPDAPPGVTTRVGDAADADDVAKVSSEHDVIISAIGPSRVGERVEVFLHALRTLAQNVGPHRLIVVGGSGSLFVAPGLRLLDTAGFPMQNLHEARAQLAALEQLRNGGGFVDWVYVSPAPITTPGRRTGVYRIGSDMVLGDVVSAEDMAVAILDEIEHPAHRREQFAVSN